MNTTVQTSDPRKQAKGFRLFKRDDAGRVLAPSAEGWRDRPYYFDFTYRKQRYVRCLETNDAERAQTYARAKFKEITEAVVRDDHARLQATKLKAPAAAMLDALLKVYRVCGVDAGSTTRTHNEQALLQILRTRSDAPRSDALTTSTPITAIDSTLAGHWFKTGSAKAIAAADQSAGASIKRSYNSRFVQAKSLFVPKALAAYREAGCYHHCLEQFAAAGDVHKFSRVAKIEYNPPAEDLIARTLADWEALDCDRQFEVQLAKGKKALIPARNLFLAIGHELAFGIRAREMSQARWSWWNERSGYPVLDGACQVKNGSGIIQVRALDPWFTILRDRVQAKHWRTDAAADDYILTGTKTDRTDATFRAVSDFLRRRGWDTMKTNHALRAFAGSQVAMKYGIYEAQVWLRHSTVKVTEQHYSHFIKRFRPDNVDALPARWATQAAAPQPQLRLLESPAAVARN